MRVTVVHNALPDVLLTPFSMRHPRASKGLSVPDHVHNEGMLVLVHEGLVLVQSGAEVWTVLPGSLGWIPPGVTHAARWFGEARGSFLYVRPDACARLPDHCRSWPSSRLIDALMERFTTSPPGELSEAYLEQLFEVLLVEVKQREHAPVLLPMPDDPRLQEMFIRDRTGTTTEAVAPGMGIMVSVDGKDVGLAGVDDSGTHWSYTLWAQPRCV